MNGRGAPSWRSPVAKFLTDEERSAACSRAAASEGDLLLAVADADKHTALTALGVRGLRGYRRQRFAGEGRTQHLDTPEDRHRFLGFSTALLAALAAVAVFYQTLPVLFIGSCR